MQSPFRWNENESRYELEENGQLAFADVRRENGRMIIPHVEAHPDLRGTGAAGRLMQHVADTAKKEGVEITPLCGYAASWLKRHG